MPCGTLTLTDFQCSSIGVGEDPHGSDDVYGVEAACPLKIATFAQTLQPPGFKKKAWLPRRVLFGRGPGTGRLIMSEICSIADAQAVTFINIDIDKSL